MSCILFWGSQFGVDLVNFRLFLRVKNGADVDAISAETEASLVHFLVKFWVCSPTFLGGDFGEERDEFCCWFFGI